MLPTSSCSRKFSISSILKAAFIGEIQLHLHLYIYSRARAGSLEVWRALAVSFPHPCEVVNIILQHPHPDHIVLTRSGKQPSTHAELHAPHGPGVFVIELLHYPQLLIVERAPLVVLRPADWLRLFIRWRHAPRFNGPYDRIVVGNASGDAFFVTLALVLIIVLQLIFALFRLLERARTSVICL